MIGVEEKERICYIRKMSGTIIPSEEEKRDLYNLTNNVPFDDRVNREADLADLNLTLIQAYLKEVGSSMYEESKRMDFLDLCRDMNIMNTLPEYTKPKNVGLMFFSLEPDRFFLYAQIDAVQFPEDLGGDQIIIEIVSHPGADRSISEEDPRTCRAFNRRYRNRRIGDFLKEMHLTKGRTTGFRKILNAPERNGSPEPIFETDPARLSFCTTIFIHPQFLSPDEDRSVDRNGTKTAAPNCRAERMQMILSTILEDPQKSQGGRHCSA